MDLEVIEDRPHIHLVLEDDFEVGAVAAYADIRDAIALRDWLNSQKEDEDQAPFFQLHAVPLDRSFEETRKRLAEEARQLNRADEEEVY